MIELEWSNQIGSRGRKPWLLLIKGETIYVFTGENIPGVVAIVGNSYCKNGRWSENTFRLSIAEGVRTISGRAGWETGTFLEGLAAVTHQPTNRWVDVSNALGVSMSKTREWLLDNYPKAASKLDAIEDAIAAIDEAEPEGAETITVSFGSPTRRYRDMGFWDWPIVCTLPDGSVYTIKPENGWSSAISNSDRVKILSIEKTAGHGGGYVSVRLACPDGSKAMHTNPDDINSDW